MMPLGISIEIGLGEFEGVEHSGNGGQTDVGTRFGLMKTDTNGV